MDVLLIFLNKSYGLGFDCNNGTIDNFETKNHYQKSTEKRNNVNVREHSLSHLQSIRFTKLTFRINSSYNFTYGIYFA